MSSFIYLIRHFIKKLSHFSIGRLGKDHLFFSSINAFDFLSKNYLE